MGKLLKDHLAIKAKYPDAVLLFRVGDFYEAYNDDAEILAQHMGVTLMTTNEDPEIKKSASMSHYWLDRALQKLVKAGYKVAICDKLEAPKAEPMQHDVTEVVKPPSPQGQFNF